MYIANPTSTIILSFSFFVALWFSYTAKTRTNKFLLLQVSFLLFTIIPFYFKGFAFSEQNLIMSSYFFATYSFLICLFFIGLKLLDKEHNGKASFFLAFPICCLFIIVGWFFTENIYINKENIFKAVYFAFMGATFISFLYTRTMKALFSLLFLFYSPFYYYQYTLGNLTSLEDFGKITLFCFFITIFVVGIIGKIFNPEQISKKEEDRVKKYEAKLKSKKDRNIKINEREKEREAIRQINGINPYDKSEDDNIDFKTKDKSYDNLV